MMSGDPPVNTLYTDTDVNGRAIRMARRINPDIRIVTADEVGMRYASDPQHFAYAIEHGYVLVTGNIQDYRPLVRDWLKAGKDHPGIAYITDAASRRPSIVAQLLVSIAAILMTNREEWK